MRTTPTTPAGPPSRQDARRNRDRILQVADEAFTQAGTAVSLDEIARRAGLSRATVYRHFPDRQALAAEVAVHNLAVLQASVRQQDCPFRALLRGVLSAQAAMPALTALMRELPQADQERQARRVVATLAPAFRRAKLAGEIRTDAESEDLLHILQMLDAVLAGVPDGSERQRTADRMITLVLDGLAPPRPPDPRDVLG